MGAHEILFAQVRWEPTKAYARHPQAPQAGPISGLIPPVRLVAGLAREPCEGNDEQTKNHHAQNRPRAEVPSKIAYCSAD
jgi:hypothetical protein